MAKAASTRKALSKRVRFEVFKRDKFTCQYCGSKASDVVLQVDHIHPVSKGGDGTLLNLLTSCVGCNGGKGATPISDGSALDRQHEQLARLEERRQQIEMMVKWREELGNQDEVLLNAVSAAWSKTVKGWSLSEVGRAQVLGMIKKHGFPAVMDAIDAVRARYPAAAVDKATQDKVDAAFKHLKAIVKYGTDPVGQRVAYIIGILRNRLGEPMQMFRADIKAYVDAGVEVGWIHTMAARATSWRRFQEDLDEALSDVARGAR